MIDASQQIRGALPVRFGGTGNALGDARGIMVPIAYFPSNYSSGGTAVLPYGALVKIDAARGTCIPTAASSDRAMGVSLGTFDPNTGGIDLGGDVAAGDMAAIALLGWIDVLFDSGTYTAGQFAYPSSTSGESQAATGFRKNAIGQLTQDISGGGIARVLVVNVLGSLSAGSSSAIARSFFGAVAVQGDTGLMADAGHEHEREPDISALVTGTPSASASTAKVAHPAADAIDGDTSTTYWESDGGSTPSIVVDLGFPRQIVGAALVQRGDGGNHFGQYTLAWSDDNSTWHDLNTRTGQGASIADAFLLDHVIEARYWRWTVGSLTGNAQVWEVDVRAVPYGPIDETTGKIPVDYLDVTEPLTNPMTDVGDLIVGDTGGDPIRLPIGDEGQVLTVVSGAPSWEDDAGGGGGSGGPTGVNVPKGTTLARSNPWTTTVESWTGSGLSWSSAGWVQISSGGNGTAMEPSLASDGAVEYSFQVSANRSGQGSSGWFFDFHLASALGDYVGWRISFDTPNGLIKLIRRYNDLGVISSQTVMSIATPTKATDVIDVLVRYETQHSVDAIKLFVDGTLILSYPGSEFSSGGIRFGLNNAVAHFGGWKVYTA